MHLTCPPPLQVRYPASQAALPLGLSGQHFKAVLGANQSMLEALSLKRGLKGPCWLLLQSPVRKEPSQQVRARHQTTQPCSAACWVLTESCIAVRGLPSCVLVPRD
jgi:hypothetical protein